MVEPITIDTIADIPDAAFRRYAKIYLDIQRDFEETVATYGLEWEPEEEALTESALRAWASKLEQQGADVSNDCKSIHVGWISPSCISCRLGIGTETFLSSTQCPRNCYFCFNPNQADYEHYRHHVHDMASELQQRFDAGVRHTDLAVTGGEPLLHREETLAFFQKAHELEPKAYTRLYTSGAKLDERVMHELAQAGLEEIRFSVKLDDPEGTIRKTLERVALCVGVIPHVMVEMPVMPDQTKQMKALITQLDRIGCDGINLLELCFPFNNANEFAKRGYRLKAHPYRVLYNYWYSGGLPIAGSEQACLQLIKWGMQTGISMGIHYCSLENKLTGQVYQQNRYIPAAQPWHELSQRDYFLKSAKVFGPNRKQVRKILQSEGETRLHDDSRNKTLEFPLAAIPLLKGTTPDMPIGVCSSIAEMREGQAVLRELAVGITTPRTFDYLADR